MSWRSLLIWPRSWKGPGKVLIFGRPRCVGTMYLILTLNHQYRIHFRYIIVIFQQITLKRHPTAPPWGRGMGCLLEFKYWATFHLCYWRTVCNTWGHHQMETLSSLLALCVGNSPVTGEFPTQRPVKWSFDVFFDLGLNNQLSKQSWGWWFWCYGAHYDIVMIMWYFTAMFRESAVYKSSQK